MNLRKSFLMMLTCAFAGPAMAEDDGISSLMISRCAGKVGMDTRQSDAAFALIALDGVPWVTIERTETSVGTQEISTTITGTGTRRRRNGTSVPFRFTCVLDARGQALMFHASHLMRNLGDTLPPATLLAGSATYLDRMMLPRGVELRVQLLDLAKSAADRIIAEQVIRSGWQVPIPFELLLPKDWPLDDRKLAIAARLVLAHQTLFQLREPRTLTPADLRKPVDLVLEKVEATKH